MNGLTHLGKQCSQISKPPLKKEVPLPALNKMILEKLCFNNKEG